ncbi:unnamed protein product [Ectocarpus sp. 12 AP-2014]
MLHTMSSNLLQSSLSSLQIKLCRVLTKLVLYPINSGNVNNSIQDSGIYAIHAAAVVGDNSTIKRLVELGANIHKVTIRGETALHLASLNTHVDTIKLLIELGADVSRRTKSGRTALDYATPSNSDWFPQFRARTTSNDADAIRVLQQEMNKHFPDTVSHTETFDYRDKVCIGRALAIEFAPYTERTRNFVESPIPDMKILSSCRELEETISAFIRGRPNTLTVVKPPAALSIPDHFTPILLYHHNSSYYIWYMNPWGFTSDADWYRRRRHRIKHPIVAIREYVQTIVKKWSWWSNYNIVVIDPEASMTSKGPQEKSRGTLGEKNAGIKIPISNVGQGTCVTWGEMYLYDVSQWLDTLEGASLTADEFQTSLKVVFGRNISGHNAFASVSLFAFHRWANKGIVPQSLLHAIYKAIPTDDPAKVKAAVVRADDIHTASKLTYLRDKLAAEEIVRKFLTESGLCSREIRSLLKQASNALSTLVACTRI